MKWPKLPLRRIARIVNGGTPTPDPNNWGGSIPWATPADFGDTFSRIGSTRRTITHHGAMTGSTVVPPGSVLLSTRAPIGHVAITETWMAFNQGCRALTPSGLIDPIFLGYQLESFRENLQARGLGSTFVELSSEAIASTPAVVPPIDEQRRIADFLDAETARIDKMISIRRRQLQQLAERYSILISEFTAPGTTRDTPRSPTWPWLPADLKVARLGYFARVQSGVTVHGARTSTSSDIEVPYLRVANVQGERIDLTNVSRIVIPREMALRSTLRSGDVVMTEANGNPDNLGRGGVWLGEIPDMVHQNHLFAVRTRRDALLPEFLSFTLASIHGRRYFRFTSTQVGIATTSSSKVLDLPVAVIPVTRQQQVVTEARRIRELTGASTSALNRQIGLLAERRQALITAAVTGQIDVSTAGGRGIEEGAS
ncbi:restriction endonuclease subunit S [Micromonosporaceae bacterium DT194]|uniref:restriction endonuclease subunit S n=1 Tax=Melissospora conviva TaxID=3388432 RepID=UPI003C19295D